MGVAHLPSTLLLEACDESQVGHIVLRVRARMGGQVVHVLIYKWNKVVWVSLSVCTIRCFSAKQWIISHAHKAFFNIDALFGVAKDKLFSWCSHTYTTAFGFLGFLTSLRPRSFDIVFSPKVL